MSSLLPNSYLFHYEFPINYQARLPKAGKQLLNLSKDFQLPYPGTLDDRPPFGAIRMAWNKRGLGLSVKVSGKSKPIFSSSKNLEKSDGIWLWVDTRNAKNTHRANRYCHQLCLLPQNSDQQAELIPLAIAQAKEQPPQIDPDDLAFRSQINASGYQCELWIPTEQLNGFESRPDEQIGFHYLLRDQELGLQSLTVGEEFPIAHDPSQWSTLILKQN